MHREEMKKMIDEHDRRIREQTIDEFAEKLCDKVCDDAYKTKVMCSDGTMIECDIWTVDSIVDLIFDMAEQMKGGAENDK